MTAVQNYPVWAEADPCGLGLLATPRAPGAARRHVRSLLAGNDCSSDDLDLAVLLASELVTNAVLHGAAPIVLHLRHWNASVRVEVEDSGVSFAPSTAMSWDLATGSGRGLALVQALATSWGSTAHHETRTGKTVWFEIVRSVPSSAATS